MPELRHPSRWHEPPPPPPRTPSCHPHSAQRQRTRVCAVRSVTAPHTRTPCAQGTRAVGPGAHPKDGLSGEGECLNTGTPHLGKRSPPPGILLPPPRRAMSERACEPRGQCRAPTPARCTHSQWAAHPDCPPEGRAAGGG